MLKRFTAMMLILTMMMTGFSFAFAENADNAPAEAAEAGDENGDDLPDAELTDEQQREIEDLDRVDDDAGDEILSGNVYHEPTRTEFTKSSPAIYTAKVINNANILAERKKNASRLIYPNGGPVDILYVGTAYVVARYNGVIGYIKRDNITKVTPVDAENTAPYGTQKHSWIATTATTCHVRKTMSDSDESYVVLNKGTMLSIWKIQDGWAIVNYWRTYGYINVNELTDLIRVSPTDEPLSKDTPIAAYTSYYKMVQTEVNLGRITNIRVACERLTRVMQPGEELNFNKNVGPYKPALGYQPAWVLVNGTSVKGYGGGTCQVSSTLYNALLQLPGITILQRRPHGPSGATYLPHGVDAAVGNSNLNLRFRNDYDFPIRVEGHTSDDGALLMIVYRAD